MTPTSIAACIAASSVHPAKTFLIETTIVAPTSLLQWKSDFREGIHVW